MSQADLPGAVLDASALIALILGEAGAGRVRDALRRGALISTINWAEALSRLAERGDPVDISVPRVTKLAVTTGTLAVVPFDDALAIEVARLRMPTKSLGLSLADRACLALGRLRRLPVLTTDRAWRSLHLSVKVQVIR